MNVAYVRCYGRTWHLATVDERGYVAPYALCQRTRVLDRWLHVYRVRPATGVCKLCDRKADR